MPAPENPQPSRGPVREEYIASGEQLRPLLDKLVQLPVWAFDTEFVGEETYIPKLCLVQVATPDALYLVDPLSIDDITPFWRVVAEPGRRVVVARRSVSAASGQDCPLPACSMSRWLPA